MRERKQLVMLVEYGVLRMSLPFGSDEKQDPRAFPEQHWVGKS